MPNAVIDLRKLKNELKGTAAPESELAPAVRREFPVPSEESVMPRDSEADRPPGRSGRTRAGRADVAGSPAPALIEWQAAEFESDPERSLLLLLVGLLLAVGGAATLLFWNLFFAVFLLIAGGLVVSYAYRAPRDERFAVTSRGVRIGRRLYGFEDLKSFWIAYDPPLFRELILESKKAIMPLIRAPIGELDPVQLRKVLLRFLPEVERDESLIDILAKRLGF